MSSIPSPTESVAPPRLLEHVRGRIGFKHYSMRTEQAYLDWIKRFIRYFRKRHPKDMGAQEAQEFLTHLAAAGRVAASSQDQRKSALPFLDRKVFVVELPCLASTRHAAASTHK